MTGPRTVVEHSLDDLRSDDVRFLQEAADGGELHVRIPSDALVEEVTGAPPKFPVAERLFLAAVAALGELGGGGGPAAVGCPRCRRGRRVHARGARRGR